MRSGGGQAAFLGGSAQLPAPRPAPPHGARGSGSGRSPRAGQAGGRARAPPPLADPRASGPRAAPRAEHFGQWLLLPRPPIPGRSPSAPILGMVRTGRETVAGRCGVRRPRLWLPQGSELGGEQARVSRPAGDPESAGTGSHFPAAPRPLHPWGSQGSEWDGLARVTRQVGQRGAATAAVALDPGFPRGLHGDREKRPWEGGPLLLQALLAGVGGNSRVGRCPLLTSSADTTMEGSLSPARFHKIQGRFSWALEYSSGGAGLAGTGRPVLRRGFDR